MRVLIIEDSKTLCDSLRVGLQRAGYDALSAYDGERGLGMARAGTYDVVILDLMLPGIPGLEVLRQLRAEGADVHVLVLTAQDQTQDRIDGLNAGADDYLGKPFSFDELLARIQALTRRRYGTKNPQIEVGDLLVDTTARTASRAGNLLSLTNREYRLLELLAVRAGETVSRMEIEEHLYGCANLPLSNVVDSAVCSIRSKLREQSEVPLIHTRPRLGYVLATERP